MSWQTVRIGEFLKRSKIPVDVEDSEEYKRVTIRGKHQGVSLRDVEQGKKIGTKKQFLLKAGQFVLSKIDARYGAFGIAPPQVDGSIITGNFWAYDVDKEKVNIEWFNQYTNSPIFYDLCERASSGITHRKYLDESFFLNYEVDLPSIDEQRSIIDLLKDQKRSIKQIASELNHQLALVKELRKAYLREAIKGKLVLQCAREERAEVLFAKIKAEKEKLIAEKKIKQGKIQEPEKREVLFDIPSTWVWCLLDHICIYITDGTHQTPTYTASGRVFLSAQNVKPFRFLPDSHKLVSEEAYLEYIRNRRAEKGDLLVARVGAGIGEAAVIDKDIDFAFYVSLGLVKPFKEFMNSEYVAIVLNSPFGVNYAKGNISSKGGSAGNFNLGRIRSLPFPLPPVAEQERIVVKLKKLMKYCEELEENIRLGVMNADRLLQTALKEALEPKDKSNYSFRLVGRDGLAGEGILDAE